jgi:hypothetical protein
MARVTLVAVLLLLAASDLLQAADVFTNSFLVRLKRDHGVELAKEVAARAGFESLGPVSKFFKPYAYCFLNVITVFVI